MRFETFLVLGEFMGKGTIIPKGVAGFYRKVAENSLIHRPACANGRQGR